MKNTAFEAVDSVPELLRRRRDDTGVALRVKRLGLWREISWHEYATAVQQLAAWLTARGTQPGDRVALLGENCPEWLISDLAVQSAAGITVGVYATSSPEQLLYCLRHAEVRGLILEDAEQLEKWLAIRDQCPEIEFVLIMEAEPFDGISQWQDALSEGARLLQEQPELVNSRISRLAKDDVALFIYTSGTTGDPKAAMLSHGNLLWAVDSLGEAIPVTEHDEFISFLPLSHIVERLILLVRRTHE